MRLWHKDIIRYLPRMQLLSQWRELKCIAKNIKEKGTPNHILVNKIMDYDLDHFCNYAILVYNAMIDRGYKVSEEVFQYIDDVTEHHTCMLTKDIFPEWHNERYLMQCFLNLQEKYDCGGLTYEEWLLLKCNPVCVNLLYKGK